MLTVGDGVGSAEGDGAVVVGGAGVGPAFGSGAGDEQAANRPTIAPSRADRTAEPGIAPVYHGRRRGSAVPTITMYADEVHTDPDLVRRLVAAQFPEWVDLPRDGRAVPGMADLPRDG